jgi:CIC family chloride channel protein
MDSAFETVTAETPISEVRTRLQAAPCGELFVVDSNSRLTGIVAYSDMHEAAYDTSHDAEMTAADVARGRPAMLLADDDLETAVKTHAASGEVYLPVVDDAERRSIIGIAHEHKVMLAYHRALDQARAEERGEI